MSNQFSTAFIRKFRKSLDAMETVTTDFSPPKKWYTTGNLSLNRIMSGSFMKGIPEGRITVLAGPSGSGKSFLLCNMIRNAQKEGAFALVIDSERALDKVFMSKIGVNVNEDSLFYAGVTTVNDVTAILSDFIGEYEKEHGRNNPDAPHVIVGIDSLDMLLTESENEKFDKGVQTGDQGQKAKQIKHMLRTLVSRIGRLNITLVATHQVYANQDLLNGEGLWVINNSVKYSASQIFLITKLKLKEEGEVTGIRMRVETYKSRFAKLGSRVEIDVPYTKGMNPFSGLLEMLITQGIVNQGGAWYTFTGADGKEIKFQKKNMDADLVNKILQHPKLVEQELIALNNINADGDLIEQEIAAIDDMDSSE